MKLYINPNNKKGHINKEIYGHFSEHLGRCIYGGIFVGENSDIPNTNGIRNDVVQALRNIQIPVLRWPGGCFADEYHWKDGIGPKALRKKMINTHWGGIVEDNSFGTDEFMELCRQLGCKSYINGNLGSGTVAEMSEWVEYLTYDGVSPMSELRKENGHEGAYHVDYFAVGNENWGCGGNMNPEYYGNLYRQYQTYLRNHQGEHPIKKIACGPNSDDFEWTRTVLETTYKHAPASCHGFMDGLSLHYYTVPKEWANKGSATDFNSDLYYQTLKKTYYMETLINGHSSIMDQFDPEKKIGLMVDEWGCWYDVESGTNPGFLYQQNTMRDAIVAAINLNIFNQHCDRVKMANIAQMVNVLQSVILTEGEKMIQTPTYYVFDLFKKHMENELVDSCLNTTMIGNKENQIPNVSESVSMDKDQKLIITLSNNSVEDSFTIETVITDAVPKKVSATILHDQMTAHNTFEEPNQVAPASYQKVTLNNGAIHITIPPCSVLLIEAELESVK